MYAMFHSASSFNGDISKWDVSRVIAMGNMFSQAASFNQELCGANWIRSKAEKWNMFEGSSGSISRTACTSAPIPERDLIARTPISTLSITPAVHHMTCPRCGTFRKSGRVSCCAPGGAWFKNCGGLGIKNVDHRWSEGVKACKRKFNANNMYLHDLTATAKRFPVRFFHECSYHKC